MAIKSKGRARGGRSVAAAPRRPLVVRKPPIWRRPWVWGILGALALGGILTIVVLSVQNNGREGRRAREKSAVQTLYNKVVQRLPKDVQPVPPDVIAIFPSVQSDFTRFGTEIKGDDLTSRGEEISADAQASSTALNGLNIEGLIPAEFAQDRQTVLDARLLISQAIAVYDEIGGLISSTAGLSQEKSQAVLDQVQKLMNQAGTLFDQGYLKLTGVAKSLDIPTDITFNPPPAAPASPTPSESASAEPSASGSASAEPSASATATSSESASPSASP